MGERATNLRLRLPRRPRQPLLRLHPLHTRPRASAHRSGAARNGWPWLNYPRRLPLSPRLTSPPRDGDTRFGTGRDGRPWLQSSSPGSPLWHFPRLTSPPRSSPRRRSISTVISRVSSSFDGGLGWPRYGPMPLTRCPECRCLEPLVRLRCKRSEHGNYGREFVKCESKPQPGKVRPLHGDVLKQCKFFMWMDDYIAKLQSDGMMKGARLIGSQEEMMVGDKQAGTSRAYVTENWDIVAAELKKMNGNLSKII
ncbi:hypothetical protein BAE44_0020239, partial [Dichanthelium oligosanthes]